MIECRQYQPARCRASFSPRNVTIAIRVVCGRVGSLKQPRIEHPRTLSIRRTLSLGFGSCRTKMTDGRVGITLCALALSNARKYCVMLALSDNSLILLINPDAMRLTGLPDQFRARVEKSRALLHDAARVSGVSMRLLGAVGDSLASFSSLPNCRILRGDTVNFWRLKDVTNCLGPPETRVVYCGGAWLDEEVFVAALSALQIGYDTRVLVDVSVARTQFDRACVLERLVQHGVIITTVRQTMVEWSLAAPEDGIGRQLRDIPRQ